MPNNKCLKIIFNLKKRESYLKRYFLLLQQYPINFDILLINDLGTTVNFDVENTLETKIIYSQSKRDITGMNSIFKAIYDNKENLKNYKYICFVEDDNFIFPDNINECVKFLENNKNFIGCNEASGISFPDNSKLADLYGLKYFKIDSTSKMTDVIKKALSCSGGVLCEVMLTKDYVIAPKLTSEKFDFFKSSHRHNMPSHTPFKIRSKVNSKENRPK